MPPYKDALLLAMWPPLPAVVAARSSGLTALAVGGGWCGGVDAPGKEALGVMDPVPDGVAMLDGSSDMNMVAELGEMR